MSELVELLLFKCGGLYIGIDSSEISKVKDFDKSESDELVKENNRTVLYADTLLKRKAETDYYSTLMIKNRHNEEFILHIGTIEGIITIPEITIMPLPGFVKTRQNPFIVWGFVEKNGDLIMLLTFDYYNYTDN